MNREIKISIWTVAIAIASIAMPLTACSSEDNEVNNMPEEEQQTASRLCAYVVMPTQTRASDGALFTDDDIEWFDVNTRELRFRDSPTTPNGRLQLLGPVDFFLDGEFLFEGGATYVGLICSQVFLDLVLCQGRIDEGRVIDDCYYLQDCYPLECAGDEEVKNNRIRRSEQWEKFTKFLESKGKLRK